MNRPKRPGLWTLIQFFIELAQERGYATVTVKVQDGQIGIVHVDRTYTLDQLPIRDKARMEAMAGAAAQVPQLSAVVNQ